MRATSPDKTRFWQRHVEAASRHSGSEKSYCKAAGIKFSTFGYWKRKLSRQPAALERFVPVEVIERNRCQLPDPEWLAEFLTSLSRRSG